MDQLSRRELRSVQGITKKSQRNENPNFTGSEAITTQSGLIEFVADNLTCEPQALGQMYDRRSENVAVVCEQVTNQWSSVRH